MDTSAQSPTCEYRFWWALFSGAFSAASLVSLVTKTFRIGLAPLLDEFITYYRKISYLFVDWATIWIPFQLPDWYKDCVIISFLLGMPMVRALCGHSLVRTIATGLLLTFTLLGSLAPVFAFALFKSDSALFENDPAIEAVSFYVMSLGSMLIASIVFFALNSQL